MDQAQQTMPGWWLQVMEYLRVAPGRAYAEQLLEKLEYFYCLEQDPRPFPAEAREDVVAFLNRCTPEGTMGSLHNHFLKTDVLTNGVYTVPSQRVILDAALKKANPEYVYNPHLYMDQPQAVTPDITLAQLKQDPDAYSHAFRYDPEKKELSIDLTRLTAAGERLVFEGFDLNEILSIFADTRPLAQLGMIHAPNVIFTGPSRFVMDDYKASPVCAAGLCFNGASFCGKFEMQNITFAMDSGSVDGIPDYDPNKVDFRNARFFGNVSIRDVRFIGDALDSELSLEDARVQHSIEFFNVDFGHTNLNCFQMVVGDFIDRVAETADTGMDHPLENSIRLSNVTAESDVTFDFTDVEMHNGQLLLQHVPDLPGAKFCLSPICCRSRENGKLNIACPHNYLLIQNCNIHNTLYIGNFSEVSFWGSHNYDRIVSASNWGKVNGKSTAYRTRSRGIIGTSINNDLLLAVYNNRQTGCFTPPAAGNPLSPKEANKNRFRQLCLSKAYDFILLKENFQGIGLYDDEDVASVLYMEFKPYVDSTTRTYFMKPVNAPVKAFVPDLLYKILYSTGKYGISPLRVAVSTCLLVFFFSCIYGIFAMMKGTGAFTLGGALNAFWESGYTAPSTLDAVIASLLYSLECVVPFISQFEPIDTYVCIATVFENAIGSFLVGYFSIAVVRKTLRS